MTIIEVIDFLNEIAKNQKNINSYGEGDIYDFFNGNPSVKYSTFFITQGQHKSSEEIDNYSLTLFYVDRLTDDGKNKLQIQSVGKEVLNNIITVFKNSVDAESEEIVYQPFTQRFVDNCAGVYAQIVLQIYKTNICADGDGYSYTPNIKIVNQTKDLKITKNGEYVIEPDANFTGLDRVNIDVDVLGREPVLEPLTVNSNGVYKPEEYTEGFNEVTVDVQPKLQDKAVTVTKNGEQVVNANPEFDGLKSVIVTTDVKAKTETKSVKYTENGIYKIDKSENVDGITQANVEVAVPIPEFKTEIKTVEYKKNGKYKVAKSANIDGMTEVDVNVNVAPKLQAKTTTKNGDVVADKNYDGLSKVTVNVPAPKLEKKQKTVTENKKHYMVTPTDGFDGLKDVDVYVNVPIPQFKTEQKSISVTQNGQTVVEKSTGIDGMLKVIVDTNVQPKLQEKTAVANGPVVPDASYDGLSKVNVDVPAPVLNSLHTSIDKNGQYLHKPSENEDGWDSVIVNVNVPSKEAVLEPLTATRNGRYAPDAGVDGYNEVNVNVPQKVLGSLHPIVEKNGRYEWTPSKPTDGWYYVELNVNVPTNEPILEPLTVTTNGKYTPKEGVDGYNEVNVELDVPVVQQNKTFNITTNNSRTILAPDPQFDAMSSAEIFVDVPTPEPKLQEKTTTENGVITPDTEFDGLSKVTVNVPAPKLEAPTFLVDANRNYTFKPNDGFDGFSSVNVNVNVAGSETICRDIDSYIGWGGVSTGGKHNDWYDTLPINTNRKGSFCDDIKYTKSLGFGSHQGDDKLVYMKGNVGYEYNGIDTSRYFKDCINLFAFPKTLSLDTVSSADEMFMNCKNLRYFYSNWISAATSTKSMFENCEILDTFNEPLELHNSKDCSRMFYNCKSLVNINEIHLKEVLNCDSMFKGCTKLRTVTGLKILDCENPSRSFSSMFSGCENLQYVNNLNFYESLETGGENYYSINDAVNCLGMFFGCRRLKYSPVKSISGGKLKNTKRMFYGCTSLKEFPSDTFGKNLSTVEDMEDMFKGCYLNEFPMIDCTSVIKPMGEWPAKNAWTLYKGFKNLRTTIKFYDHNLSIYSISNIIENVANADPAVEAEPSLGLSIVYREKVTNEDKQKLTAKGWKLVFWDI